MQLTHTRLSLAYLATYLNLIGVGMLFAPATTLALLQSNGNYGDVFPRVAGMLLMGLGITVVGMIRSNTADLYPATLAIRAFFLVCLGTFYAMSNDVLFLVLMAIVLVGFLLTAASLLADRRRS